MNILAYLCSQHMKINNERVPIQRNYALILKKKTIPLFDDLELEAHPLGQLDGGHGEGLVGPLGLHLEGSGGHKLVVKVLPCGGQHGLGRLLAGTGTGQTHDAEDGLECLPGPFHIALFVDGLHVGGGLAGVDAELAVAVEAAADIAHQFFFKTAAVQALQNQFAQLEQEDFIHVYC